MSMKYGCIGEVLKHSFSKEIHSHLAEYDYKICEVERDKLGEFAEKKSFKAINVTIPYKEMIIPYLYYIDPMAKLIGAVNTVVNKGGRLYGYNTDFYGMKMLLAHAGVELKDKKVIILGTGGTSKTAVAVATDCGAKEVIRASRTAREDAISYQQMYREHTDAEVIINTTPVGMYPNILGSPVDIDKFPSLVGVIDAVYNPLSSELVESARARGIAAEGGLYMLVAQAVRASEIFIDKVYPEGELERVYKLVYNSKRNIVLTGMPASGKSTVGKILARLYSRELVDTDTLIEKMTKKSIPEIFKTEGEEKFREYEREAVKEASAKTGVIIATGGGAVLCKENIENLKKNGRIYFIDRPLEALVPTDDRPLSSDKEAIKKRYEERYSIYCSTADIKIGADCDAMSVAEKIKEDFDK